MDWATFIEKVGYPIAVTFAIAGFAYRLITVYIWPLIVKYVADVQASREQQLQQTREDREQERLDRIAERDIFIASLAERDKIFKEAMSKLVSALDRNTKMLERRNQERTGIK